MSERHHPPFRHFAWHAYDGTLCIACCECGAVLQGGEAADAIGDPEELRKTGVRIAKELQRWQRIRESMRSKSL
jgi:hypothetical protein